VKKEGRKEGRNKAKRRENDKKEVEE